MNLAEISVRLGPHTETPSLDAHVLFAHILQKPKSWLLAHPETQPNPAQAAALEVALQRLENGEPLPYVLGHWEFYGLDFQITPDVLIPRPETELLVESALAWARTRSRSGAGLRLIEIGTGSGCISVCLASLLPEAEISATDISSAALVVARLNAEKHGLAGRIRFYEADLFPASPPQAFDLILSNPPYIPTATLKTLAVSGREPTLALDGGPDGLAVIRRLLDQSQRRLAAGGAIRIEIESGLGQAVLATAQSHFPEREVQILPDLAGLERLLVVNT